MPDYKKGAIYMLEPSIEYDEGDVYYGSTTQLLHKRLYEHKKNYKYNRGCKSKILIEKYGIENIKIILIKYHPCENKTELEAEEAKYIRENKCVNLCEPGRGSKEKVKCECGCVIVRRTLKRHQKLEKHINLINYISN